MLHNSTHRQSLPKTSWRYVYNTPHLHFKGCFTRRSPLMNLRSWSAVHLVRPVSWTRCQHGLSRIWRHCYFSTSHWLAAVFHPTLRKPWFAHCWKKPDQTPARWRTIDLFRICHFFPSFWRELCRNDFRSSWIVTTWCRWHSQPIASTTARRQL